MDYSKMLGLCNSLWWLYVVTIVAATSTAVKDVTLDLSMTESKAFPGMVTEISCIVTPYVSEFADKLTWVKRYAGIEKQISVGTNLFPEFSDTRRYHVYFDIEERDGHYDRIHFYLKIENLRPEDAGHIGCALTSVGVESFKELIVFSPVVEMDVNVRNSDGVIESGVKELPVKDGEQVELNCHVHGGYPSSDVSIFLGREEITRLFKRTERLVLEGDTAGLQKQSYTVSMLGGVVNVGSHLKDKSFRCVADIPGTIFPATLEYSFKIEY